MVRPKQLSLITRGIWAQDLGPFGITANCIARCYREEADHGRGDSW